MNNSVTPDACVGWIVEHCQTNFSGRLWLW